MASFSKPTATAFAASCSTLENVDLSLSAALSPPAFSDKIRAHAGIPDHNASVEFGLQLDISLWEGASHGRELKRLPPLRAAFTLEGQPQNLGWVAHPKR